MTKDKIKGYGVRKYNTFLCNMKLTGDYKTYWKKQIELHTRIRCRYHINNLTDVEYGKQDIRGGWSICLYKDGECITQQHFPSRQAMLYFIQGYNEGHLLLNKEINK